MIVEHFYSASAYIAKVSMQNAILAMIDSVTRWYHAKTTPATMMRSSLEDSPMTIEF